MTLADEVREIARCEALAAAWNARAREKRDDLRRRAVAEFEAQGVGVTWRIGDLGKVTLPLSTEAPIVADADLLCRWVERRHPDGVQTVKQVRSSFQTELLRNVTAIDGVVTDGEGEIIPGLGVREGGQPKALTITVDAAAKKEYEAYAEAEVARQLIAEYGDQAVAPVEGVAA